VPWGAYNLRATSDVHEIRQCVTMAKGVLVRADFDCVDADPFVFDHQVMVRLVSYGDHVLARVILSFVHDCSKAIVARAMPTTYGQFVNLEVMGRTAGAAGIVTLSVIQESGAAFPPPGQSSNTTARNLAFVRMLPQAPPRATLHENGSSLLQDGNVS